jgi:hypothetical protein
LLGHFIERVHIAHLRAGSELDCSPKMVPGTPSIRLWELESTCSRTTSLPLMVRAVAVKIQAGMALPWPATEKAKAVVSSGRTKTMEVILGFAVL